MELSKLIEYMKLGKLGRLTIPSTIKKALLLDEGMLLRIIGDVRKRRIIVETTDLYDYRLKVTLQPHATSITKLITILEFAKARIVMLDCNKTDVIYCDIIADMADVDVVDLQNQLKKRDFILNFELEKIT